MSPRSLRLPLAALVCALLCAVAGCTPAPRTDDDRRPDAGATPDAGARPDDKDGDGSPAAVDCDDGDPAVHPGAAERCNGKDDDCDGQVDEPDAIDAVTWYADEDRDGFGLAGSSVKSCRQPQGFAQEPGDCDDTNRLVHPGGVEQACNGLDDDCDPGTEDDGDRDGDGATRCAGDCDDQNANRRPGKAEVCDGIDNDCNEQVDDGLPVRAYYPDADGDGFGSASAAPVVQCGSPPAGYVLDHTDCDDTRKSVRPGASEISCNVLDDDCNPATPDAPDLDHDGVTRCAGDCDDGDPARTPGKPEICDGKDNDCNGLADDGLGTLVSYRDNDRDGWGDTNDVAFGCIPGGSYVSRGGDCNDADPTINPGAQDPCTGVDRSCDGAWTVSVPAVCSTLQQALDASLGAPNARITVAPGTYRVNLDFKGSQATVVSQSGAAATILDGGAAGPVVVFRSGETRKTTLEGFTLQYGTASVVNPGGYTQSHGGGIQVEGTSPTLRNLVVRNCSAGGDYGYGGGISLERSQSLLERVTVENSTSSHYAGGIYVGNNSNVTLKNVRLSGNSAPNGYGGGIAVYYGQLTGQNVIFAGNSAGAGGGGLFVQGNESRLTNATFHANRGRSGAAIQSYSGAVAVLRNVLVSNSVILSAPGSTLAGEYSGSMAFSYSAFFQNQTPLTSGFLDPTGANFNVANIDPRYVDVAGTAASSWDLHLQASSQLKSAGMNDDASRTEIGAYGGPGAANW